jgi:hypothetical protein
MFKPELFYFFATILCRINDRRNTPWRLESSAKGGRQEPGTCGRRSRPFSVCFSAEVETLRERAPDIVAIDGKTSRRTHARAKPPAAAHGQRLGRPSARGSGAGSGDEKANEIVAIPLLLERLQLTGALVTIDAMWPRPPHHGRRSWPHRRAPSCCLPQGRLALAGGPNTPGPAS